MKLKNRILLICIIISAAFLSSCNNTRYLAPGQALYTGANIDIVSEEEVPSRGNLKNELEGVLRPDPNNSFLGLRPSLWIYNIAGEPRKEKGGFRRWVRENMGEPPVLLSDVSPATNMRLLQNRIENNGFFDPEVSFDIRERNQRATIDYKVQLNRPYRIKSVTFPGGDLEIERFIREISEETLLIPGEPYNLDIFVEERGRIDAFLKERGYFYFNPEYIIFRVDTTAGPREVAIYADIKRDIPRNAIIPYRFKNIYVNPHYSLDAVDAATTSFSDTIPLEDGIFILSLSPDLKPSVFNRAIFLRQGNRYRRRHHEITLSHLMGLGVFQFVNIRFEDLPVEGGVGYLNAYINCTPTERKSVRFELRAVSKSNNFAGPGFNINFRNRNTFGGAELFILNLRSSYETIITGIQRGLNSYEIGASGEIQIPRFVAPFHVNPQRPIRNIPRTRIMLGYTLLNRVEFFWLNSVSASFGYLWNETLAKRHELNPISTNYVRLGNASPRFEAILENNPILRRSFEQQLILGSVYTYTYNDQLKEERRHNYFFMGNIDLAGNTLFLLNRVVRREPPTEDNPYGIMNIPFSQYARGEIDFRHYFRPGAKARLVSRLWLGSGIAYGNAMALPYIKQFFIGGANSIRAFAPRSLGPGSVEPFIPEDRQALFLDQVGDIKMEGNIELRFPIIAILKGAVFLDAGNIWTMRESDNPRGLFKANTFYREIAVGTGTGLRLDASFFVLRFDLGIPLRKPWLPLEERWVIDEISFGDPAWRRNNLVLNIAIGYPF
jgi:outer membrane protein insertion porin family